MKKKCKVFLFILVTIVILIYSLLPYPKVTLIDNNKNAINEYMIKKLDELRIQGAAIGIVNQGELYMKGYGKINSKGDKMTPQSVVLLGSTTKSITALAVMQLADIGKLKIDDPVITYLPEFAFDNKEVSSTITIRQLLNQNSGIASPIGGNDYLNTEQTSSEFVRKLSDNFLSLAPGKDFQYAEANYIILGQIIEVVSGQTYASYVEENIFKPLKMTHSYTTKEAAQQNGLSDGYRTWYGFPVKVDLPHPKQYLSASGLYSSVEDLVHYITMYLGNGGYEESSLISETSLLAITNPAIPLKHPAGYSYGMGWFIGDGVIMHDGRPTNYYSVIVMEPGTERGIVLLANVNNRLITAEYMMPIAYEILNAFSEKDTPESFFGFRQIYRILNLLLLFMFALPLYRFISLIKKRNQNKDIEFTEVKKIFKYLLPDLINFAVVLSLLLWLLNSYGVTLQISYLGQPDIVLAIMATLTLSAINILLKLLFHCMNKRI